MTKILVDSSVIISGFGKADEYTSQSNHFFGQIRMKYDLVVPDLVLVEVAVKLSQQKIPAVQRVVEAFMEAQMVAINDEFVKKCLKYLDQVGDLRSSDFSLAVAAKLCEATLVSWDKRLLANKICRAVTPTEFLAQI